MEARWAETPDVALAAPFTTARPPEAGRENLKTGLTPRTLFVLLKHMDQHFKVVQVVEGGDDVVATAAYDIEA